jgi:hypothetical protein
MKQYVLDVPAGATPLPADAVVAEPPAAEADAPSLRQPGWWRWFLLALLLEPVALAILYLALSGTPGWSQAATSEGIAQVALSSPREPQAAAPAPPVPAPAAPTLAAPAPAPEAPVAEAPASRISQERGRYVVELHDEALAPALAMLTQATKARVAGSNIFIGSPLRLTRSAVAATPREAWQAVFGDIANFAIACAGSACEVRFVSLLKNGSPIAAPDSLQGEYSFTQPAIALAPAPPTPAPAGAAAAQPVLNGDGAPVDN